MACLYSNYNINSKILYIIGAYEIYRSFTYYHSFNFLSKSSESSVELINLEDLTVLKVPMYSVKLCRYINVVI